MSDKELIASRIFPVTPDVLFTMRTNPDTLAKWRGPNGFTNTFSEFNPVAGWKWVFVMHGPDGRDYPNECEFVQITPYEKIILNHTVQPYFQLIATFTEVENGTHLEFRQVFENKGDCDAVKLYAIDANEQNLDRLESLVH